MIQIGGHAMATVRAPSHLRASGDKYMGGKLQVSDAVIPAETGVRSSAAKHSLDLLCFLSSLLIASTDVCGDEKVMKKCDAPFRPRASFLSDSCTCARTLLHAR